MFGCVDEYKVDNGRVAPSSTLNVICTRSDHRDEFLFSIYFNPTKHVSTTENFETGVPPARSTNWKWVLGFLGVLALTGGVLTLTYGNRPKKHEPMAKRTSPAVRSVYALILSPLDSLQAKNLSDSLRAEVSGPDSSDINMIVASSAIYKRFVSAAEFCRVLEESFRNSRSIDITKQAVLISQLTGILVKDTMRTKLCLFGQLASTDFAEVSKQMSTSARIIVQRNTIFGPVEIHSYINAQQNDVVPRFLEYFTKQGIPVVLHNRPVQSTVTTVPPHS